jgi:uncharacterized Zn-binding protein involved in type VI secretion
MASPDEMAAYYADHPQPPEEPDPNSPTYEQDMEAYEQADAAYDDACDDFDAAAGPPPTPDPPPAPPTPGAGMPAARIGDLCAHGGAIIGPGCPTVLIGMMPAVRGMPALDQAVCPMFNGPVPHVSGTILKGSTTVLIGYMPAARVGDPIGPPAVCAGNTIVMGHMTTMIGG